jgi:HlyD family secretion protein
MGHSRVFNRGLILSAVTAAAAVVIYILAYEGPAQAVDARHKADEPLLANVSKGDLDVRVVERGTIETRRSVVLASELPSNRAKIIQLVPEGTFAQQGDVIVKFDPAPFQEDIQKFKSDLEEARAALMQANEEKQMLLRHGKSEQSSLQSQITSAQLNLENLKTADLPMRIGTDENKLAKAKADMKQAQSEYQALTDMLKQGFARRDEVEQARVKSEESQRNYQLLADKLKILKQLQGPAEIKKAEVELSQKREELKLQKEAQRHRLARHQAGLLQLSNRVEALSHSLQQAQALLDKTVLRAPVSGFVIYKQVSVQGERRKVQVGDSVWQRNGFMVIPDMSALVVQLKVREADIGHISAGQKVAVTPEAYPDMQLEGKVELVGTLATNDDVKQFGRHFAVKVGLEQVSDKLRPGMTARVSILTAHVDQALRLPVEAVFYQDDQPLGYRWQDGKASAAPLELGQSDGDFVQVVAGLVEGDRVLLQDPHTTLANQ